MRRLEPVLRRALSGPCRLPPGSRVLVAASGGADSTALLVALRNLAREHALSLTAAHLHHRLRGAEADRDLEHVRALCVRFEIPLVSARWNTRARMRRRGLSGQAGLRVLRREFLLGAARRARAQAIATAHTADDQLETLLLRLGRGAGLRGLAGIAPRAGAWVRPLLEATRSDIEADLVRVGIAWCEDSSNRDPRYARSRIRHDAIPALGAAVAGASSSIESTGVVRSRLARTAARIAREAREAREVLAQRLAPVLPGVCRIQDGVVAIQSVALRALPAAGRRVIFGWAWDQASPPGLGLTRHHMRALENLTQARDGAQVELPEGFRAKVERNRIRIARQSPR